MCGRWKCFPNEVALHWFHVILNNFGIICPQRRGKNDFIAISMVLGPKKCCKIFFHEWKFNFWRKFAYLFQVFNLLPWKLLQKDAKKNLQHFWESRAEFWSPGLSYGNNTWNTSPQKHCKIIFLLPFEAFFVKKTVFLSKKDENSILQHFYEDCSAQYCCPGPSKFNFHPHLPLQHLLRPPGNEKKYFFVCSVRNKIKKENPTNI